ncbi:hypothetical protein [Kitasatospora griseola]|uniref:hypothetical protein n=1 Tax=Kitasatospora griseola TaxID=2064 RepID=UPI00382AD4F1
MSHDEDDTKRVIPGNEPVTEVTVHMHMVYGANLPDPLDTLVLLHLMFMVAGGTSPTAAKVLTALRAEGIQAGNGSGLIGRDAVQASFRRLTQAGFLRRIGQAQGQKGRFGGAGYELYRRPSYNPDWVPSEPLDATNPGLTSPQVTPQTALPSTAVPSKRQKRISAGQTANGIAGHGTTGTGNAGRGQKRISAGQTANGIAGHGSAFPPHPQEEVTTSSPNPRSKPTRSNGAGAREEEEGVVFDPEETAAAVRLLQVLPDPWTVGRAKAKVLAPGLLEAMADQGWPAITKLDSHTNRLLVQQLTKNPGGIKNYPSILERDRIPNLPLFEVVAGPNTAPTAGPENPCPSHPRLEAARCPQCAADDEVDRQRRALDSERGIDDASALQALASLIQQAKNPRTPDDRKRDAAARQAAEARRQSAQRAEYLAR